MSWMPSFLTSSTGSAAASAPAPASVVVAPPLPKQPHRQLIEYLMEPARRQRVLYVLGGGVALLVSVRVISSALSHSGVDLCGRRGEATGDGGSGDDIEFGDPTETRFNMFMSKLYRTHEAALLKLVDDLEALGEAHTTWTKTGKLPAELVATPQTPTPLSSVPKEDEAEAAVVLVPATEEAVAELEKKIRQVAIHADEVLTQYVCKLDGAPVKGSAELKQRRRDMIKASHVLGERIAPYLPSAQAAPPTVETAAEADEPLPAGSADQLKGTASGGHAPTKADASDAHAIAAEDAMATRSIEEREGEKEAVAAERDPDGL